MKTDQLRRYLADAYKRGADHERDGQMPEGYEMRIRESEIWANRFVSLRADILEPTEDGKGTVARRGDEGEARPSGGYVVHCEGCDLDVPLDEIEHARTTYVEGRDPYSGRTLTFPLKRNVPCGPLRILPAPGVER